ncbi:hypothetical protein K1719_020763 [Acacia pycnantha]|nr:hypothetical protein K1719_020763 [Acacia pycnantha]
MKKNIGGKENAPGEVEDVDELMANADRINPVGCEFTFKAGSGKRKKLIAEEFLEVVDEGWNGVQGEVADRLLDLVRRLEACKRKLLAWSKMTFPNFKKVIDQFRRKLQLCSEGPLNEEKLREAEELSRLLEEAWVNEESYWWQWSRISWLKCGDKNTKFFHNSVIQRRQRNKILRLKNDRGVWLEEREEINKAFRLFYQSLFHYVGPRPMNQALSYVKKLVTAKDNEALMLPVSNQEIEEAKLKTLAASSLNSANRSSLCASSKYLSTMIW